MTRTRLARAGALVGAGALAAAAAAPACRRHEPVRQHEDDCLRLDGPSAPVGFDAMFSITAAITCPELRGGRIDWQQIAGPPVSGLSSARDGFEVSARTPALADVLAGPIPWGVVPLSPRTRGEIVLRATWSDGGGRSGERKLARDARVAAADRSRGLPNTPVGVRIHLGGQGWHVTARPANSNAALAGVGAGGAGVASLLPDVAGDWRLADGAGRTLALHTARYDETPLDCGRSGCHPAITDAAAASPMTSVLARLVDKKPSQDYPGCAVACHATGEPGAADGGFAHVVSELGAAGELGRRWHELPRDLRRLGGVGCLACHGPGAIPEPAARWSVLRADICAVCHDAPPRYGHVLAWRLTAMARADQDPRARSDRACVRCHTTWGFLETVAAPERQSVDRRPPGDVGPLGIGCAACHAVHDSKRPGARRLLRATPTPALLAGAAREDVCLPCHTPDAGDDRPRASAAALWLGRGGLDPATGAALTGGAPHAGVPGGCVGCHRAGPDNVERGAGHGFRAPASVCAPCHRQRTPSEDVRARAQQLWRALRGREASGPPHAGERDGLRVDRNTPLGRATWDLLLVLEDPAAGAHNARYAQALLDAAASVLEARDARDTRRSR